MTAKISHRDAQPLDHVVKHGVQVNAVRFLPEDLQEARYIPAVRYLMLVVAGDADEGT